MEQPPAPRGNGRWVGGGAVAPNETYVGQRLLYQRFADVEQGLADIVDDTLARRILSRTFGGAVKIGFSFLGLAVVSSISGSGGGFQALAILLPIAWVVLNLALPVTETLSDWHLLLDGKAGLAESAYAVVLRSLRYDHQIPAESEVRRLRVGPPIRGVRNFLMLRLGTYRIYVSVFGFGRDLYLGWTLRRRQRSVRILLRWIASRFGGDPAVSDLIDVEPVKAMRDAVHNALRQSIETAAADQQVSIVETFGYDIPVTDFVPHGGVPAAGYPTPPGPRR